MRFLETGDLFRLRSLEGRWVELVVDDISLALSVCSVDARADSSVVSAFCGDTVCCELVGLKSCGGRRDVREVVILVF